MMIDATIVRAHQHSAGARKKKRPASDRPITRRTDHQSSRARRGQAHHLTCAQPLLENADPDALIGDKAYHYFGRFTHAAADCRSISGSAGIVAVAAER
jgi:hypothetical protein